MNAAEALKLIREMAKNGQIEWRYHSFQRSNTRRISRDGAVRVLKMGFKCEPYDATGWRVFGKDENGDVVGVGVYIEDNVIVATVMWP